MADKQKLTFDAKDSPRSYGGEDDQPKDEKNAKRSNDVYSRLTSSSSYGRGMLSGWVRCPLCPPRSNKRFSCGRGIAAHLHAVHTPWNPSRAELRRRERSLKRKRSEIEKGWKRIKLHGHDPDDKESSKIGEVGRRSNNSLVDDDMRGELTQWHPSVEEVEAWGEKVIKLTAEAEETLRTYQLQIERETTKKNSEMQLKPMTKAVIDSRAEARDGNRKIPTVIVKGRDRTGKEASTYRNSLPQFIRHAADGDLVELNRTLEEDTSSCPLHLLDHVDRNGSTAEQWAAGGGHTECLKFLLDKRAQHDGTFCRECVENKDECKSRKRSNSDARVDTSAVAEKVQLVGKRSNVKKRRRDGKTPLHFAARNGQVKCVELILDRNYVSVDACSGDDTTPLHLACYGGQPSTVKELVARGSDPQKLNIWGCGAAHWVAMSIGIAENVVEVCNFLKHSCGVSFHFPQRHGHTPLHKAAQKKNIHVIRWLKETAENGGAGLSREEKKIIGLADKGGNRPSDILSSVGGSEEIVEWMRQEWDW